MQAQDVPFSSQDPIKAVLDKKYTGPNVLGENLMYVDLTKKQRHVCQMFNKDRVSWRFSGLVQKIISNVTKIHGSSSSNVRICNFSVFYVCKLGFKLFHGTIQIFRCHLGFWYFVISHCFLPSYLVKLHIFCMEKFSPLIPPFIPHSCFASIAGVLTQCRVAWLKPTTQCCVIWHKAVFTNQILWSSDS